MCRNKKCTFKPNFEKLDCGNIFFGILILVSVIVIGIYAGKYYSIESLVWTTCYPVEYSAQIGICHEIVDYDPEFGLPEYSDPYPIKGFVVFQYQDAIDHKIKRVTHNPVCAFSTDVAIAKGQKKYPSNTGILCGQNIEVMTFGGYEPVMLFPNGKPSNQLNIIIGFSIAAGVILVIWLIVGFFQCDRRYTGRINLAEV